MKLGIGIIFEITRHLQEAIMASWHHGIMASWRSVPGCTGGVDKLKFAISVRYSNPASDAGRIESPVSGSK